MQVGDNFYWTGVTPKVSSQELFFWCSGIWKHAKLLSTIFSILDVAMKFSDCICMNRLGRRIGSCVGLKCSWRYHTHAHSPGSGGPTSVLLFNSSLVVSAWFNYHFEALWYEQSNVSAISGCLILGRTDACTSHVHFTSSYRDLCATPSMQSTLGLAGTMSTVTWIACMEWSPSKHHNPASTLAKWSVSILFYCLMFEWLFLPVGHRFHGWPCMGIMTLGSTTPMPFVHTPMPRLVWVDLPMQR